MGRIFLALLGMCLACVAGEVGLRLWEYLLPPVEQAIMFQPDDELGWVHVPGLEFRYAALELHRREYLTLVRFNAMGLRGEDVRPDFGDRCLRILLLGNSFTESVQVPEEGTAARQLERDLNSKKWADWDTIQVFNAGVSSYGVGQCYLLFHRLQSMIQPQIVALEIAPFIFERTVNPVFHSKEAKQNNIKIRPTFAISNGELALHPPEEVARFRTLFEETKREKYGGKFSRRANHAMSIAERYEYAPRYLRWIMSSYLLDEFWEVTRPYRGGWRARLGWADDSVVQVPVDASVLDVNLRVLEKLRDSVRTSLPSAELIVTNIGGNSSWDLWNSAIDSALQRSGFRILALHEELSFELQQGRPVTWKHDFHWNELGNAIYARAMAREIGSLFSEGQGRRISGDTKPL